MAGAVVLNETPIKSIPIECFLCLNSKTWRSYRLDSLKCKKSNFSAKLIAVFGEDTFEFIKIHEDVAVCFSCFSEVEKAYGLITTGKLNMDRYANKQAFNKRSIKDECGDSKRHCTSITSARKLNFICADESPFTHSENSASIIDHLGYTLTDSTKGNNSDHSYASEVYQCNSEIDKGSTPLLLKSGLCKAQFSRIDFQTDLSLQKITEMINYHVEAGNYTEASNFVVKHKAFYAAIKCRILHEVNQQVVDLCSKASDLQSIQRTYSDIEKLNEPECRIIDLLIKEIYERCPFLLDMMVTVGVGDGTGKDISKAAGPIAATYGILMHLRNIHLSAFQKVVSPIAIKGNLNDMAFNRLQKMGIILGPTSKIRLLTSAAEQSRKNICEDLKNNPLIKITGDNLDVYVRAAHQSSEHTHTDLHMFSSNVMFSRIAHIGLSNEAPSLDLDKIQPESFIPNATETSHLLDVYSAIIVRIMVDEFPAFKWMKDLIAKHIPHRFSTEMSKKSIVHPLPIQFKNEGKYEECIDILDGYEEEMQKLFNDAYGNTSLLDEFGVVIGGDQLTRVRLQGAKRLRCLSRAPSRKFQHLNPIIIEMWHNKQDFLHKAYKALFSTNSARQSGTLYNLKVLLRLTDVNGNVKSNFKAHANLLEQTGRVLLVEQILEFFGMESTDTQPTMNITPENIQTASRSEKLEVLKSLLTNFLNHYGYCKFSFKNNNNIKTDQDKLYNYCTQLCHWALHFINLNDTTKEGDLDRLIINCKYNIPFFYSSSALSKYYAENVDYILKVQHTLSPLMKLRVLEGSFVNVRGGKGNNLEADLVQEHSIRNRKDLIRNLGANKSESAMSRVSNAADGIASAIEKLDENLSVKPQTTRHSKTVSSLDKQKMQTTMRSIRPFLHTPGRDCLGYRRITQSPFDNIDRSKFRQNLAKTISRLSRGQSIYTEIEEQNGVTMIN